MRGSTPEVGLTLGTWAPIPRGMWLLMLLAHFSPQPHTSNSTQPPSLVLLQGRAWGQPSDLPAEGEGIFLGL